MAKDKNYVLATVKEQGISFIEIWFVDILGQVKSFSIMGRELERALNEGMGFDGSSIEGFARIYESDLIALPDPKTFIILPWNESGNKMGRMFADILTPNGESYVGDSRYVLKKSLEKLEKRKMIYNVGAEMEYFYFKNNISPQILDDAGYFDLLSQNEGEKVRRETIMYLENMGMQVEYSHHEVAPSQHEIDIRYADALTTADNIVTFRVAVKEIASRRGLYATFMPKPLIGENGSGMHIHQSIFNDKGKNLFFDKNDKKYFLSKAAKEFTAGILNNISEITAVTNQWVNSYKRLVPGYEAPVYVSWGQKNRSTLIRVPYYKPGKELSTRIELRSPDPACNPYLAFSVILSAGLEGIENNYQLPPPLEEDIYNMSFQKRLEKAIKTLPGSLIEAILLTEKSNLVKRTLGEHIFEKFIENKKIEWDMYRTQISDYEIKKYLPLL